MCTTIDFHVNGVQIVCTSMWCGKVKIKTNRAISEKSYVFPLNQFAFLLECLYFCFRPYRNSHVNIWTWREFHNEMMSSYARVVAMCVCVFFIETISVWCLVAMFWLILDVLNKLLFMVAIDKLNKVNARNFNARYRLDCVISLPIVKHRNCRIALIIIWSSC